MTTLPNGRTPAPVDSDGALDWTPPPNFPRVVLQTLIEYEGKTWMATFNDTSIKAAADILRDRACTIIGIGANPTPAAGAPQTRTTSDEPPLCQNRNCTNYGKPMAEGRYSKWACRGKDPTTGNQKGYCKSQAD